MKWLSCWNFEYLFNIILVNWKIDRVDFRLKYNAEIIQWKAYPVPKLHEEIFKKEVDHLVLFGVHKNLNDS